MIKSMKQLKKVSTKELVIKSLQDYIVINGLQEGDSLPSEHVLTENLGVSRNILREAMQYFRTLGIIGSKPKTGAYIKQLTPENPFQGFMPYFSNNQKRLKNIAQLRQIVELGAVPSVIEAVRPKQINLLREAVKAMNTDDINTRKQQDIEFHTIYLSICDNKLLDSLKPLLIDYFENCTPADVQHQKAMDTIYIEHMAIINALEKRDPDKLQKAILNHYNSPDKPELKVER